jgi:DNA repair protein RadC
MTNDKNLHEGHRSRILEKATFYPDSLTDTELLEVLLFQSIKRKDTSPIAKNLLKVFGSIQNVLDADPKLLLSIDGVGKQTVAFLKLQSALVKTIYEKKKAPKQKFVLRHYKEELIKQFNGATKEIFRLYLLDKNSFINGILEYESNYIDEVKIDVKDLAKSVAIINPHMAIMVHNHFSNDVSPSHSDDLTTIKIRELLKIHGVKLADHIIVCGNQIYSYFYTSRVLPDKTTI